MSVDSISARLQNSRISCERERRSIFERKVWSECKNGEEEWGEKNGRVRLTRFTHEDHAYGAPRLPNREKTTVWQFK